MYRIQEYLVQASWSCQIMLKCTNVHNESDVCGLKDRKLSFTVPIPTPPPPAIVTQTHPPPGSPGLQLSLSWKRSTPAPGWSHLQPLAARAYQGWRIALVWRRPGGETARAEGTWTFFAGTAVLQREPADQWTPYHRLYAVQPPHHTALR